MARRLNLLVAALVVVLGCGIVAEARQAIPAFSPIDINFDARPSRDEEGKTRDDARPRREDVVNARDDELELKLRIDSLIGDDAQASGEYSLYVDGIRIQSDAFDTRYSEEVGAKIRKDLSRFDTIACAVINIYSANFLGRPAPKLEGVKTKCIRLVSDVVAKSAASRLTTRLVGSDRFQPASEKHELRFDEPLTIGALKIEWMELLDSRCPKGVECFWAGAATIILGVTAGDLELPAVVLTLGPGLGGSGSAEVVLGGYAISLLSVEPYPEIDVSIPREARFATLLVTPQDQVAMTTY